MPARPPAFPPDVVAALQAPAGRVSVRYTLPAAYARPREHDVMLMQTPYERVLVALVLDTKQTLRFVRTGSAAERARVVLLPVADELLVAHAHWDITLEWDAERMHVTVRDRGT